MTYTVIYDSLDKNCTRIEINLLMFIFFTCTAILIWWMQDIREASLVIVYPPEQTFPSDQFGVITVDMGTF